jgi:hypothetical protein
MLVSVYVKCLILERLEKDMLDFKIAHGIKNDCVGMRVRCILIYAELIFEQTLARCEGKRY